MYIPIWLVWASVSGTAIVSYIIGSLVSNSKNACICMDCRKEREGDLWHGNI